MTLSSRDAKILFQLGFKRVGHESDVYPQDVYEFNKATWVVGGRIFPSTHLLSNKEIYQDGIWIPSLTDLMEWLDYNDCEYTLNYYNSTFKINVSDVNGKQFKAKGGTAEFAFYKVITKLLEIYQGNIVSKDIHVIEAELTEREDL
jgi:hypothetical protein